MYIYDRPKNNVGKKKKKMQIRDLFCSETAGDRNEVCNQTGKKAVFPPVRYLIYNGQKRFKNCEIDSLLGLRRRTNSQPQDEWLLQGGFARVKQ